MAPNTKHTLKLKSTVLRRPSHRAAKYQNKSENKTQNRNHSRQRQTCWVSCAVKAGLLGLRWSVPAVQVVAIVAVGWLKRRQSVGGGRGEGGSGWRRLEAAALNEKAQWWRRWLATTGGSAAAAAVRLWHTRKHAQVRLGTGTRTGRQGIGEERLQ